MPLELSLVAVVVLLILAAVSAFISGIETALFSMKDWRLHRWRKKDPKGVEQYEGMMKKPREVLSVILLVDTLVNILLILLTVAIARSIAIPFPYWVKTLFLFALIVIALRSGAEDVSLARPVSVRPPGDHAPASVASDLWACLAALTTHL